MDMLIYTSWQLLLYPSVSGIKIKNIEILIKAAEYINNITNIKSIPYKKLISDLTTESSPSNEGSLFQLKNAWATWRPLYCVDICIYVTEDPRDTVIALKSHDEYNNVEFFATHSLLSIPNCSGVVLLAHITCDRIDNENTQMSILVYDVLLQDTTSTMESRYSWLKQHENEIRQIKIGKCTVCVQWIGHIETHNMIVNLDLPHAMGDLVILSANNGVDRLYTRIDTQQ
jgi:hypothetical protein